MEDTEDQVNSKFQSCRVYQVYEEFCFKYEWFGNSTRQSQM